MRDEGVLVSDGEMGRKSGGENEGGRSGKERVGSWKANEGK